MWHFKIVAFISLLAVGSSKIHEEIFDTDTRCGKGRGRIIQIGLTKGNFDPKIDVCFDFKTYMTFWTSHYIDKDSRRENSKVSASWSKEFFDGVDPSKFYKDIGVTVDKGHLTPKGDFGSDMEKKMTFFYINAAPQVSGLNRGNWRIMEEHVRKMAEEESKPVKVITGTGGSLFTIDEEIGYDFPEYFFKVVIYNKRDREVYIANNDLKNKKPKKGLCTVISGCGWSSKAGGTVYCCKYNDKLMDRLLIDKMELKYGD